ncbi:ABC transporter permease/M1 family aminopeptidase [Pseudomarimonas arenosa]|uniref:ABC transporter permease subunit n=1 Tax=Pseudomarimonas arenosa TaxID=2774145 RepID=A0AAW3ZPZ6_9GAMM|nr:M1 family aminopeptidase [Pseudomarimonas arenosa]MBD8527177.1 ABC transporter permease subunit [Pseudomarimonas arenosa]
MLKHIFAFELRQQFGNPVFWIVAVVFGLLAFGASSSDAVEAGGAIGNVLRNAPVVVINQLNVFSVFGMLLVVIFVAGAALRDFDTRSAELFFSSPVKRRDYLLGRFLGGYSSTVGIMLAVAFGLFVGTGMPWVDVERLGPTPIAAYAWAFGVLVLPNLLFISALLFTVAVLTRSTLMTYVGVIAFFALSIAGGTLTADLDTRWIAAMLDPFGQQAIDDVVRYWSAEQRNTQLPELGGVLIANRLIWIGISLLLLAATARWFRTDREGLTWRRKRAGTGAAPASAAAASVVIPRVTLRSDFAAQWQQFLHQAWFDTKGVLKGVPLLAMLLIGLFFLIINLVFGDQLFGTTIYPTTGRMTDLILGSFGLFMLIIVGFYAGELVFRERQQRIAEVTDAFANSDWVPLAAKAVALTVVVYLFYSVGILVGIGNQIARGYYEFELTLYLQRMGIDTLSFILTGILALFLHVLSNNKAIGYLLTLLYIAGRTALNLLDYSNNLYRPMGAPPLPYSDMNGFGHFLVGHLWFRAYWGALVAILFFAGLLLWVRGNRASLTERLREARRRLRPAVAFGLTASVLAFLAIGSFAYYNTMVLAKQTGINAYVPDDVAEDRLADYEKQYAQYKSLVQPKIRAITTQVDIEPKPRRVRIVGEYQLENDSDQPIDLLHVEIAGGQRVDALAIGEQNLLDPAEQPVLRDETQGLTQYRLAQPLQPGDKRLFVFDLVFEPQGFGNDAGPTQVVHNGSFFNSGALPSFGYNAQRQLTDRSARRKRGLGEPERMPKIDDESARQQMVLGNNADWIAFETTVSTDPDQIALAPGYLQREWEENGRRYFHYKMDVPMVNFAAWLSADWAVKKDKWNDVALEVYYHPAHHWNVDRMIEASKKSFDYFTREFTPFQFRQLRILEFPRYANFAQSFANTVPFSEGIGFIADLRDKEDIDYVFYVTAHEIAHQWWGHQVVGANQQGSTMLIESLSQYSALMVMEKEYGKQQMRRFLKYELDRYLRDRAGELVEELPLALVENQQYIHYRKGSMVFYALKEAVGEQALNAVLRRYLQDNQFQSAPYTNSREFLRYLREGTDAKFHPLIEELFEKIVFYDNRVVKAEAKKRDDGKYVVSLELKSAKFEADGKGKESPLALGNEIEIGVFARPDSGKEQDEKVLYLQKHRIDSEQTTLEIVVDEQPYDAGIDPYNKLIDRVSDDNRKKVSL